MYKYLTIILSVLLVGLTVNYAFGIASAMSGDLEAIEDEAVALDFRDPEQYFLLVLIPAILVACTVSGCDSSPPPPPPPPVCTPGTHQCVTQTDGCHTQDCVNGEWVDFVVTAGACNQDGPSPDGMC